LKREEIGVDFTGGTKLMTMGAIMACLDEDIQLQYVAWNGKDMAGSLLMNYTHEEFELKKKE